jgi:very-short-patch-repair endonuclease
MKDSETEESPPSLARDRARALSAAQTELERRLRQRLRNRHFNGASSGDSTPSGTLSWISSAWTRGSRGSLTAARHGGEPERHADERRTEYLASEGYRVLRFWDEEVLDNIDGVSKPLRSFFKYKVPHLRGKNVPRDLSRRARRGEA